MLKLECIGIGIMILGLVFRMQMFKLVCIGKDSFNEQHKKENNEAE